MERNYRKELWKEIMERNRKRIIERNYGKEPGYHTEMSTFNSC